MLKTRIIPTLLIKDVGLVKGQKFDSWRRVGSPMPAVKVFNIRDVDELVIFDIDATPGCHEPDYEMISLLAAECFVPLTVGGGVRNIESIRRLLQCGADKITINSALYASPELVAEAADCFGSQCVVAAIDARYHMDGSYECYECCGRVPTGRNPIEWAKRLEQLGAGEILLTSIDRDGVMAGYDVQLIKSVTQEVNIPVIASGGAGTFFHMLEVIRDAQASAVAAASLYLFTQCTPLEAKDFLSKYGIPVRKHL